MQFQFIKGFSILLRIKKQTRKQAETRLTQWFDLYLFSNFAAVRSIAKVLLSRREAVLSCVVFPYSNRVMEGTNNKIKLIKRRGLGYRNIHRFTLRVRLAPPYYSLIQKSTYELFICKNDKKI